MYFNYTLFGVNISSKFYLQLPQSIIKKYDISIVNETLGNLKNLEFDNRIKRLGYTLSVGVNDNCNIYQWSKGISYLSFLRNDSIYKIDTNIKDEEVISAFITNELVADFLLSQDMFLLHASAVYKDNRAYVFIGEPGAGKSTIAASLNIHGFEIVSEDLTAIKLIDEKPYVLLGPSQIKLWPNSIRNLSMDCQSDISPVSHNSEKCNWNTHREKVPKETEVFGIYNLEYSSDDTFEIDPLLGSGALETLIGHCPTPRLFLDMEKRVVDAMTVLRNVPIYNFERPRTDKSISEQSIFLLDLLRSS